VFAEKTLVYWFFVRLIFFRSQTGVGLLVSSSVVLKVGEIPPLGAILKGKGVERTKGR